MASETITLTIDETAYVNASGAQPDVLVVLTTGQRVRAIVSDVAPAVGAAAFLLLVGPSGSAVGVSAQAPCLVATTCRTPPGSICAPMTGKGR